MTEKMQNLLWYAFVFLLPWQTVWIVREVLVGGEKWQYATVGIYVSDVALLACALFFCLCASREMWQELSRDVFVRVFAALLAWSLLSSLWAIDRELALLSAWRVFLMTLAYVCARHGGVSFRKTLLVFLVSMTMQAGLAFSQWVSQFVSSSSLLGIAEHDPSQWGSFVLKTESGRFLRAYGGLEHPNVLGGALAIAIFFGVWLSATAKSIFSRVGFLGVTVVSSFTLVFTFSRSAWLGFGVGMIVSGFFALRFSFSQAVRRSRKRIFFTHSSRVGAKFRKILFFDLIGTLLFKGNRLFCKGNSYCFLVTLSLVALSFFVCFSLVRDIAMSRFSEETLAREGSLSDRGVYMRQALIAIEEHPIFGVGGGNFTAFTQAHFPESGNFVGDFQPVHTVPILVFAELGAVGSVLFTALFVFAFARAWREKSVFAGMILCALLPMLFLDHWLWSGHFGVLFLGFLFGTLGRATLTQE